MKHDSASSADDRLACCVLDACVSMAKINALEIATGEMNPMTPELAGQVARARSLAWRGADSLLRSVVVVFDGGAVRLAELAMDLGAPPHCHTLGHWPAVMKGFGQCGLPSPLLAPVHSVVRTGKALGDALAWLAGRERWSDGATLAGRVLPAGDARRDRTRCAGMVEAAVRVPGAGALALLGLVKAGGLRAETWRGGLSPEMACWIVHGLRLRMGLGTGMAMRDSGLLLGSAAFARLGEAVAAGAARWGDGEWAAFRQGQAGVRREVETFNARVLRDGWGVASNRDGEDMADALLTRLDAGWAAGRLAAGGRLAGQRRRRA